MSSTIVERVGRAAGTEGIVAGAMGRAVRATTRMRPQLVPVVHSPRSEPVVVGDCRGWLHWANGSDVPASDVAVLLCPAIGWDGLHAYHGFRLLADQLAAAGYPTLRFQYPGTGDSADIADSAAEGHWAAWVRSVHANADWMRSATGAQRLILAGLRIGATLATVAAEQRDDVEGLILLAPVLRGKSYMRQLDMEARLEGGGSAQAVSGLDFHELHFSADTVGEISAVDLRQARLRAGLKVAILPQAPSLLADSCVQAWVGRGVQVRSIAFEGLEPMLQEAIHRDLPVPDFQRVLDWASLAIPATSVVRHSAAPLPIDPVLTLPGCLEIPVRFGVEGRLFGILCRPYGAPGGRAVIIGNTGRDPHYGIARFGVELARRLASEGTASLRMDFAGLGDSPPAPGQSEALSALFEADRTGDIKAAVDALERRGYTDFAVQGVCSGAYHAFHGAQADPRVGTLLLVNLPSFEWTGGETVQAALWKSAPPSRIVAKLVDVTAWKRALQGRVGLRAIIGAQITRTAATARRHALRWLGRDGSAHPASAPARAMQAFANRQTRMLFLYADGDPGLDALQVTFGTGGEALRSVPGSDLRIVPGLDHVLSAAPMRKRVADQLLSFVASHGQHATLSRPVPAE